MAATYALAADLRDWTGQTTAELPDADAQRLLVLAERDIDGIAGIGRPLDTTTGKRFTPSSLSTLQALVLKRVTCAQAEYRQAMGDDFFIRGQFDSTNGPDFSTNGRLPRIAPAAWRELAVSGLIRLSTTTGGRWGSKHFPDPDDPEPATFRESFERG